MSIMDIVTELSDGQDLTGAAATTQSTDHINWSSTSLLIGAGTPIYLTIKVGTAFAGAGNVNFRLMNDSDTTVTDGTLLYETGNIAYTTLVAGYEVLRMPIPVNADSNQYFGLSYVNDDTLTAGTIDAYLSLSATSSLPITTQVRASNI